MRPLYGLRKRKKKEKSSCSQEMRRNIILKRGLKNLGAFEVALFMKSDTL